MKMTWPTKPLPSNQILSKFRSLIIHSYDDVMDYLQKLTSNDTDEEEEDSSYQAVLTFLDDVQSQDGVEKSDEELDQEQEEEEA